MPEKIDSSREDGSYLHSPTFSQYNDNNRKSFLSTFQLSGSCPPMQEVCHRPGQFDIHTGGGICDLSYVDSTLWSNNDKPLTRTHLDPPPTQAGLEDLNSSLDRPYNRGYLIDSPLADGNHQLSLSSVPLVITRTHSNTRKESFGPVTPYHQWFVPHFYVGSYTLYYSFAVVVKFIATQLSRFTTTLFASRANAVPIRMASKSWQTACTWSLSGIWPIRIQNHSSCMHQRPYSIQGIWWCWGQVNYIGLVERPLRRTPALVLKKVVVCKVRDWGLLNTIR